MSSTTQSHIQTGPQSEFNFNPRLTRPDAMRQPGMPQLPPMGMSPQQHFMQNRQQPEQHGQPPMAMLSNGNNPSMNLAGGPQGNNAAQATQSHQRHQQQMQSTRQEILQAMNVQSMNVPGGGTSGLHLGGMGPHQMATVGFPGNMIQQQPQVRRVQSQPQTMNQTVPQMQMGGGAMHSGQQGGGPMGMSMNAQTSMPGQPRQMTQQQQQQQQQTGLRIHPQMQGQHIVSEMAMRQTGMPQNMQRSTSAQAQIMASLPQPPGLTQSHQVGMQPPIQPHNFQNQMSQQHSQTMSPSPRLTPRSQPQTPANMNMLNPGQLQANASRSQPDIFNIPNQQFPQIMSNNAGHANNSPFPFVPSSVSPTNQQSEMSHMSTVPNTSGLNNRSSFQPTPAQQLLSNESYYMPPPQSNIPPRPPSNNNPHLSLHQHQQPQHRTSPPQQDHHAGQQPQRPQSQPQTQPRRPPSQSGLTNTPRTAHTQLQGHPSAGRLPPLSQHPQPGVQQPLPSIQSSSGHPLPIAPRPPQPASAAVGLSSTTSANFASSEGGPSQGQPGGIQRPGNMAGYPLGVGQGLTRLLQFSGMLAAENKNKLSLLYWDGLVKEYFAPQSILKFTLWKDNQRNEAKPFDIGVPILPRFFLVTTQSGVKSMTLSLDGARERFVSSHHAVIECVTAAWTCKYTNGYTVTLRGPLTAHVILVTNTSGVQGASSQPYSLKFENLEFTANFHDKSISLESIMGSRNPELSTPKTPHARNAPTPTANGSAVQARADDDKKWEEPRVIIDHGSIPGEPVNAFGIPQATMRCLELAESVGQMADLIAFSGQAGTGPIEGLSLFAARVRETQGHGGMYTAVNATSTFQNSQTLNGVNPSPPVTLYSSVPPSHNSSSEPQPGPSIGTPQNVPPSASNSPQKQHKTIPQPPGPASTSGQASGSGSTPSGPSMTPSTSSTSLKRKQSDTASPTTGPEQHPQKRATRKRRTTGGGG